MKRGACKYEVQKLSRIVGWRRQRRAWVDQLAKHFDMVGELGITFVLVFFAVRPAGAPDFCRYEIVAALTGIVERHTNGPFEVRPPFPLKIWTEVV